MNSEIAVTGIATSGFAEVLQQNKTELAKIEQFRKSAISVLPRNLIFAGMTLGVFFLIGMFALQIITGVFALILSVSAAIGGFYGLRFLKAMDPVIRQKTKNFKIKKMMEEARRNATEQLDNQVLVNAQRLEQARAARDQMGSAIRKMESQIDERNQGKPIYERKKKLLAQVTEAYQQILEKLDRAAAVNRQFEQKVKEYKDMEAFAAQASQAMSFIKHTGNDQLEEMLSLEAFSQIETDFNTALVEIENSARDMAVDMAD